MFQQISILSYGRCVRQKENWNTNTPYAVNRIYFIHSGSVLHQSDSSRLLYPGKLYLFPQNLKFSLRADESTSVDHTFIDFTTIPPITAQDVFEFPMDSPSLFQFAGKALMDLAEQYPMHPNFTKPTSYGLVTSYLQSLLSLLHEKFGILAEPDPFIALTLDYIRNNIHTEISVVQLAQAANYEQSAFIRRFKRSMNTTPYHYIRTYRLGTALNLLRNSNLSVSRIAESVGYSGVAGFSHAFKQAYGIYPSQLLSSGKYENACTDAP